MLLTTEQKSLRLRSVLKIGALAAIALIPKQISAELDPSFMKSHSARVMVISEEKASVASGFLWNEANQVVTSLHAVTPAKFITVECGGVRKPAEVEKTLEEADLVLLKLRNPADRFPESCTPIPSPPYEKPETGDELWSYGYYNGARSGTSQELKKAFADSGVRSGISRELTGAFAVGETLADILNAKTINALKAIGVPGIDLEIYFVNGVLGSGYSGSPVVNKDKQLIGIVDGGLKNGVASYNWLIPAQNLEKLLTSQTSEINPRVARRSDELFSTDVLWRVRRPRDSDRSDSVDDRLVSGAWDPSSRRRPGPSSGRVPSRQFPKVDYDDEGQIYTWIPTNSRSLGEIARSADTAEAMDELLGVYRPQVSRIEEDDLSFAIYEEKTRNLIIVIPDWGNLEYDNMLYQWFGSSSIAFGPANWEIKNELDAELKPRDPTYFSNVIRALGDCNSSSVSSCIVDPESVHALDYGGGKKILRLGVFRDDLSEEHGASYHHYTIVVDGESVFNTKFTSRSFLIEESHFNFQPNEEARGDDWLEEWNLSSHTFRDLNMLIAANLTTFSNIGVGSEPKVIDKATLYSPTSPNTNTGSVTYTEGAMPRFINDRGAKWRVEDSGEFKVAEEIGIRTTNWGRFFQLRMKDTHYLIPVNGGPSYIKNASEDWKYFAVLKPQLTSVNM